jgi:hypothetical protein
MKSMLRFKLLVAFAVLAFSGLATAQDQYQDQSQDQAGDPPSRIMRLQFMDGQVSLQPGGVDDWVAANLNRPLTTADRIWTDRDSRAELTMASAALRMGSETSVTVTNLDDSTAQIELDQGILELSVRYLNPGEIVEVDTPNFAYTVTRAGDYRFDVLPDEDQSWITVRRGEGEVTGQGNAVRVHSGQQFRFSSGQSLSYTNSGAPDRDGFDDWCMVRERRESTSASAGYVAAGTVGYEDLDDNGSWQPTPTYGTVWYPRVNAGWAPYRDGHWAWVEPWGWTWVDDAPWGFAPFHYGRWVFVGERWGWVPGPVGVRPVYAPALVGWVGGASFGVSVGIGGGVGWFPLGWRDPYLPAYRVSPRYARNVNISNSREVNVTVVNNYYSTTNVNVRNTTISNIHYENTRVNGAVTGVSSRAFASGQSLRGNAVVVPANAIGRGSVMTTAAVVPTKEAVLGGRPPAAAPQRIVAPRQVASKAVPPPRPVSFDQQRPLLEKSNGVPLSAATRANLRANSPAPAPRGGRPVGNPTPGRAPVTNQPGGRGQVNQPGGNPPAGNMHGQPNNPNTFSRPTTPTTAAPATNTNQNNRPLNNVPRPPQANGNVNVQPQGQNNDHVTQRTPEMGNENRGRTPGTETPHTMQNQGADRTFNPSRPANPPTNNREVTPSNNVARPTTPSREVAPGSNVARPTTPSREVAPGSNVARPTTPSREVAPGSNVARPGTPSGEMAPTRTVTPSQPPRNQAPARTVEGAPQHHNAPPPPKDKKEKEKEKDNR